MFGFLFELLVGNLPTWLWPVLAGAGFATWLVSGILSHLPECRPYAAFIKPVAGLAVVLGIFMYGGAGVAAIYQERIKEMAAKIAVAEQASKDANVQVQTKIVTKTRLVHDVQVQVQEHIREVEKRIDADCRLDPAVAKILNQAAVDPVKDTK